MHRRAAPGRNRLLNGRDATIHWAYTSTFRRNFPEVRLRLEEVLLTGGERLELVMAGATSSWQDLVLYLLNRYAGPEASQALAKFMLFQWHSDTQLPYVSFAPPAGHSDAAVRQAQDWLQENFSAAHPVEEMSKLSGLPERTFKRRFKLATGYSPLHYVQNLRVEEAKRRLERSDLPVDEVSWQVGYEDPAFFRRLFKRLTRLSPGQYRKKFRIPEFARAV